MYFLRLRDLSAQYVAITTGGRRRDLNLSNVVMGALTSVR